MTGDTNFELKLSKILFPSALQIPFFSWVGLYYKKLILNYNCYIVNFINKKFVEIYFLSFYNHLYNIPDFVSWPTKPKILTIRSFVESLPISVLDSRELSEINIVKKSTV